MHRYAHDGCDPCSYAGVGWCFGLFDGPKQPESTALLGQLRSRPTSVMGRKMSAGAAARARGWLDRTRSTPGALGGMVAAADSLALRGWTSRAEPRRQGSAHKLGVDAEAYRTLDTGKAPRPGDAEGSLGGSAQKTVVGMFSKQAKQQQQADSEPCLVSAAAACRPCTSVRHHALAVWHCQSSGAAVFGQLHHLVLQQASLSAAQQLTPRCMQSPPLQRAAPWQAGAARQRPRRRRPVRQPAPEGSVASSSSLPPRREP